MHAISIHSFLTFPLRPWLLWSSVAPVCAVQQRRHYVVAPGGAVTVSCQVEAYPTGLTFTWALKNDSGKFSPRLNYTLLFAPLGFTTIIFYFWLTRQLTNTAAQRRARGGTDGPLHLEGRQAEKCGGVMLGSE